MHLKEQIDQDIKKAMREQNKDELRALRAIKSMILLAETEKGAEEELPESTEMNLLTRAAKQRRDSLSIYEEQGREDLAKKERDEIRVIERYLPKQLSPEDLEKELTKIIDDTDASGMKDFGKIMGIATKKLAGRTEGKTIADMVKKLLS